MPLSCILCILQSVLRRNISGDSRVSHIHTSTVQAAKPGIEAVKLTKQVGFCT